MSESTQQDRGLSELVVKEAVGAGMNSAMRESILEAVEEEGGLGTTNRRLPRLAASLGAGAAIGYLLGRRETGGIEFDRERLSLGEESRLEEVSARLESEEASTGETDGEDASGGSGGSRLRRVLAVLAFVGAAVLIRRRMRSDEDEAWEPIEEFDVGDESTDDPEADDEMDNEAASDETSADDDGGEMGEDETEIDVEDEAGETAEQEPEDGSS